MQFHCENKDRRKGAVLEHEGGVALENPLLSTRAAPLENPSGLTRHRKHNVNIWRDLTVSSCDSEFLVVCAFRRPDREVILPCSLSAYMKFQ